MSYLSVHDNVRLHYREAGSGPVLLFHPGFSSNLDLWNWVVRELTPAYRCITFDPRGHGDSDKPDSEYTLTELAADVAAITTQLDLRDVTLVGHSLGGAVCFTTMLDHNSDQRVARLALLAPAVPCFVQPDGEEFGVPLAVFEGLHAGLAANWVATQVGSADSFYHQTDAPTAQWLTGRCLAMPVHIAERYFGQLASIDFRDRLGDLDVPVLVIWGQQDQLADPRWADWIRENNPKWTVEMLDHSGHGLMVDEPARTAELLRAFIAGT
ncbi:alpha/beta fold hydrolase [Rhodococcus qingshengii]|uniref:alpha/beta fold hydrolase n=1 Tax=Rhodococcus qingshengii TaxID=334542 RepID=UPI001BE8EFE7|nr:alpha/beta hydrolase [Rhodococcus qingshengii]MBT2273344.1 alpha/beta hydrolase [Rhodococcus qingshengii]